MLIRTALALLLLFPAATSAQDLDTAVSAMVRISGTRNGTTVRGTGFVVGLDRDKATIVTASHVIEGVQYLEVSFAVDSTANLPAGIILGLDTGSSNGLAVFQIRGALPAGVTALSFEVERPHLGEALFLLGFPSMELSPRTAQRVLSARRGTLLLIDQEIGEGFSGGPVLKGGKVAGVITNMDGQTTYAVNAIVAREALEGWGVKLGGDSTTVTNSDKQNSTTPALPNHSAISRDLTAEDIKKMGQVTQILSQPRPSGELRNAFQLAREVADAHPNSQRALHLAGEAAYRLSRWADAVVYFRRGGNPGEDQPELLFYMAVALYESGDTTAAANALRSSLPQLKRTPYVEAYVKKILSPHVSETCVPGEERLEAGIIFSRICPGTFTMGSSNNDPLSNDNERPAHQVTLSEYWLGKTEITNEQYRRFHSGHQGEAKLPVTGISWADAKAACEYFGGRLPTEAEWEYAARAGSQTTWSFGYDEKFLAEYAWYSKNSDRTHPVGTKRPNAWGLHDMLGNVWEWVADWYDTYSSVAQTDPSGAVAGEYRVARGGSFYYWPKGLRSALRFRYQPTNQLEFLGFRCAYNR